MAACTLCPHWAAWVHRTGTKRHVGRLYGEEMPLEQWQRVLGVNLTGVFLSCQAEAKAMLPRKQGSIVNIASMSGIIVNRGLMQAHYNASKAAVIHLMPDIDAMLTIEPCF